MGRNKPIASQYSLDKLERLVLADIARLEEQLVAVESVEISPVRSSTIEKYKIMVKDRRELLAQIKEQARQFRERGSLFSEAV